MGYVQLCQVILPVHGGPCTSLVCRLTDSLPAHPPCVSYNTVELQFLGGRGRFPAMARLKRGGLRTPKKWIRLPLTSPVYLRAGAIFAALSTSSSTQPSFPTMNRHRLNYRLSFRAFMNDCRVGKPNCPLVFRFSPIQSLISSNCSKCRSRTQPLSTRLRLLTNAPVCTTTL